MSLSDNRTIRSPSVNSSERSSEDALLAQVRKLEQEIKRIPLEETFGRSGSQAPNAPRIPDKTPPHTAPPVRPVAETPDARREPAPAPILSERKGDKAPLEPVNGQGRGGKGGFNGGGGGGGRGGNPQLHKRSGDNEFRDVLGKGLSAARRNLVTVGIFSLVVNLLVLSIPIYLFNMSDRVLTSRAGSNKPHLWSSS